MVCSLIATARVHGIEPSSISMPIHLVVLSSFITVRGSSTPLSWSWGAKDDVISLLHVGIEGNADNGIVTGGAPVGPRPV